MNKKRILIADDHPAIRRGVKNILSVVFANLEFGEATDAAEAIRKLEEADWDLLILDIDFPGRSGLDVLAHIKEDGTKLPVLVFSFHREEQVALMALRAGASGYLSKDVADTELVKAVQHLFSGRKYVSQTVSEQLIAQLQFPQETAPHKLLAGREFQTFLLLARGKPIAQIARELNLSISTIHTYRARILKKMDMKSNAELTSYAFKNKLIQL